MIVILLAGETKSSQARDRRDAQRLADELSEF
jgi:putative component of toxin-antitoxin plasmid stabilization module